MKSISTVSKVLLLSACLVFATPDAQAQRKKKKKKA